jgi:5-methylcytosine-specific restriction endonuclease McrA
MSRRGLGRTRPKYLSGRYISREFEGVACPYCGEAMSIRSKKYPTKDHVYALSTGGTSEDCIVVCSPCNQDKAKRTLRQFALWLQRRNDPRAVMVRELVEYEVEKAKAPRRSDDGDVDEISDAR